jgi:hypothetical protein
MYLIQLHIKPIKTSQHTVQIDYQNSKKNIKNS